MSVAESIVMRAPIAQVGMPQRLLGRHVGELGRASAPRNGPPLAVTISASTASGSSPASSWCSAECSESTGSRRALAARERRAHERAARDEALLVRERDVDARVERRERRRRARPRRRRR